MLEREYLLNIQDLSTHFPTINMITECEWVSLVREILKRSLQNREILMSADTSVHPTFMLNPFLQLAQVSL